MANVVILMSDEHNPFFSSVYGHPFIATPNMERLAEMGTVFQHAYCPSPLCMPSRSAFIAGRRVHEIQAYSNCNVLLNLDYPSYGAVLAGQGVHTVHIGKVDAYNEGRYLGFSEMILPGDRAFPGDTNHRRRPLAIRIGAAQRADGFGPRENPFETDVMRTQVAIGWLTLKAPRLRQPWILSVNLSKPHFAHYVTQALWERYPEGGDLPEHGPECASAQHPYARDLRVHFETDRFAEDQIRGLRRGYLGCVTFVDQQLGRIMQALEQTGQLSETNVIYTSDHGEMLGKFGMWWKCALYEDAVRVPLIAAGPDFEVGASVKTPVDLLDLQAGICEAVGAKRLDDWTGTPLQELSEEDPDRVVFSEYHGHGTRSGAFVIRKGDWKLIYYMEAPHQLFNLAKDPQELENLFEKEPEKAAELERELRYICSPEEEDQRAHDFQKKQFEIIEKDFDVR